MDLFLVLQNGLSSSSHRSNVCALYVTAIFASPQSPLTPATVIGPLNTSLSSVLISLNVVDDVLLIDGNAVAGTAIGTL